MEKCAEIRARILVLHAGFDVLHCMHTPRYGGFFSFLSLNRHSWPRRFLPLRSSLGDFAWNEDQSKNLNSTEQQQGVHGMRRDLLTWLLLPTGLNLLSPSPLRPSLSRVRTPQTGFERLDILRANIADGLRVSSQGKTSTIRRGPEIDVLVDENIVDGNGSRGQEVGDIIAGACRVELVVENWLPCAAGPEEALDVDCLDPCWECCCGQYGCDGGLGESHVVEGKLEYSGWAGEVAVVI